jgi:ABC-type lipoprotein export system ATPase subunit
MLKLQYIWKYFPKQDRAHALKDISIDISKGSSVAIVGRSGSGKSTLINIMSALIRPTELLYAQNGLSI